MMEHTHAIHQDDHSAVDGDRGGGGGRDNGWLAPLPAVRQVGEVVEIYAHRAAMSASGGPRILGVYQTPEQKRWLSERYRWKSRIYARAACYPCLPDPPEPE